MSKKYSDLHFDSKEIVNLFLHDFCLRYINGVWDLRFQLKINHRDLHFEIYQPPIKEKISIYKKTRTNLFPIKT